MRRPLVGLVALLAAVALLVSGCGSLQPYALIVNGTRIPQHDIDNELKAIRGNARYLDAIDPSRQQVMGSGKGSFNSEFTAYILNQDLDYELVRQEVARRKLKPSPSDNDQAKATVVQQVNGQDTFNAFPKWYQDKLIARFANVIALNGALQPTVDPTKAMDYYNAHQADFQQACVSHILVDTPDAANAVEARLAKGEDFGAVAKDASKDTGSAQKGGDIGCFFKDAQLVPEFLNASFSQAVGKPGPPVQSQFGFHVILVRSRDVAPFDQAKSQVQKAMGQGGAKALQTWLTDALKKAKVKMNPKFGTFDKSQGTPSIQAPKAPPSATPTSAVPTPIPGG